MRTASSCTCSRRETRKWRSARCADPYSGATMLDHGILRTAMIFSSTASCVAVAPRTRWMYCTSGETSGRCISRIADFLILLSETVTFGARFGFNTFVMQAPCWGLDRCDSLGGVFLRFRFVHDDGLAVHVLAVQRGDRGLRFCFASELDEGKAFRRTGDAILDHFRRGRDAVRLHDFAELRVIDVAGQISKIDFHWFYSCSFHRHTSSGAAQKDGLLRRLRFRGADSAQAA